MKDLYIAFNCNLTNHDWAISLLDTEKGIFNIQLERIDRLKHSPALNDGYHGKLREFLNQRALGDYYVEKYFQKIFKYLKEIYDFKVYSNIYLINKPFEVKEKLLFGEIKVSTICVYKKAHHLFHATSSFYASSFISSAIITFDYNGIVDEGDISKNEDKLMGMQTIYYFNKNKYKTLFSTNFSNKYKRYGIGLTYEIFSSFIGLEEGSVMGLSSYGNYKKYDYISIYKYSSNGDILLNDIFLEGLNTNKLSFNWSSFSNIIISNIHKIFKISKKELIESKKNIEKSVLADIAAKLQKDTEDAIVFLANKAYDLTKSKNLCLAGGVALNILANKAILDKTPFENIFAQPAACDSGLTIGECYYFYHIKHKNTKRFPFIQVGYGKNYFNLEIKKYLEKYKNYLEFNKIDNFEEEVGNILLDGKIVGFFQDGVEYGPRALGNRSILALPTIKNRDKVNKIKHRELWRPLAPMVLEDKLELFFETGYSSLFMTLVSKVKKITRKLAPGIVHIDGTARYQTVNNQNNEKIYSILNYINEKNNVPILINTSLNGRGEPIVESPEDAIKFFLSSKLDYLVIGNFIVRKESVFNEFSYKNNLENIHKLIINKKEKTAEIKELNILYDKISKKIGKIIFDNLFDFEKNFNSFDGVFSYNLGNDKNIFLGVGRLEGEFQLFYNIGKINIGFEKNIENKEIILKNLERNIITIEKLIYFYIKELSNIKNKIGIKDKYE